MVSMRTFFPQEFSLPGWVFQKQAPGSDLGKLASRDLLLAKQMKSPRMSKVAQERVRVAKVTQVAIARWREH